MGLVIHETPQTPVVSYQYCTFGEPFVPLSRS